MINSLLIFFGILFLWSCTDVDRTNPTELADQVEWVNGPYVSSSSVAVLDTLFTDLRNNKEYPIELIGTSFWMSKNLDYDSTLLESSCYFNNEQNCRIYGRLYNYENALLACPTGWHLPDSTEWNRLALFAGTSSQAGKALKADNVLWIDNGFGNDALSFTALPAGLLEGKSFSGLGTNAYWWVRGDLADTTKASIRWVSGTEKSLYSLDVKKTTAVSVRCVRDHLGGAE